MFTSDPDLTAIARRIIWFEPPEKALADPARFVAYACRYGLHEDMKVLRERMDDDTFRRLLDEAPPGIIDARSWAYWNALLGRFPPPPMPQRSFMRDADRPDVPVD